MKGPKLPGRGCNVRAPPAGKGLNAGRVVVILTLATQHLAACRLWVQAV